MSLEWRQPTLETPRSLAAKVAVTTVAEVSSANGVSAQVPPPDFRHQYPSKQVRPNLTAP